LISIGVLDRIRIRKKVPAFAFVAASSGTYRRETSARSMEDFTLVVCVSFRRLKRADDAGVGD
jgi:hypothetical protein